MVPILAAISIGLILIFTLIVCIIVGYCGYRVYKLLSGIEKHLTDLSASSQSATEILTGITKICENLVMSSMKMAESVTSFQGNLFPSGSGREAFQEYTEQAADRSYKTDQLMRQHNLTYQEAKDRAQAGADDGTFFVTE